MENPDTQSGAPQAVRIDSSHLFRIGNRGFWHIQAHREYGVIFSLCGIRVLARDTQPATGADEETKSLCVRCARHK